MNEPFMAALASGGPDPGHVRGLTLYGWLVGAWRFDATVHLPDGQLHHGQGNIAAGWVLGSRAIQDVWNLPGIFHGTTLRVFDPSRDAWHILWSDTLELPRYHRRLLYVARRDLQR